jgi:WD40 repeat protein
VVNGLESAPVEVKPKTTKNTDGTLKIHVSDITTDIKITGITLRAATGTESIVSTSVWSSSRQLTITAAANGIAKIYSLRGGLVSEFSYGVGSTSITLPVGLYIVTLSDGSITKVIIK